MTMQRRNRILVLAAFPTLFLAGCVPMSPHYDSKFGDAVNITKAEQIINPDAAKNTDPVSGVDGKSAKSAMDNYNASFKRPAPATVTGVTGTVGAGGAMVTGGGGAQ
jgi:hypothetical protein